MSSIVSCHRWEGIQHDELLHLTTHNIHTILTLYSHTVFSKNGKYVAIAFESRYIDGMETILRQLARFLTKEWSVILYVTPAVYDAYQALCDRLASGIQVVTISYPLSSVSDYNNIMLDLSFWKTLEQYKKVLIFQSDTMLYRYGIEQFYGYDYVGAPWPIELGCEHPVGNGGLSMRSVSAIIDCLTNIDQIKIKHYAQYDLNAEKLNGRQPEDIIFSQGMFQRGYQLPSTEIAKFFSIETVQHHRECIGSHQLNQFNPDLSKQLLIDSAMPYFIYDKLNIGGHRFGWKMVTSELQHVFTNSNGVYFNTWADVSYICSNIGIPHNKPWVGIFHLTPVSYQNYYKNCDIDHLMTNQQFINDLPNCKGIFTLSKYMKDHIDKLLLKMGYSHIPTDHLFHPVGFSVELFDPKRIDTISTIVSLGCQLRKCSTIYKLKVNYNRIWLSGRPVDWSYTMLQTECNEFNIHISDEERANVQIQSLPDEEYDQLLGNSYVIIDLYDASANNALIECIARNIPCFVNRIPAVEEYIGSDYPLLFTTLAELESMLENKDLIRSAYQYLVDHQELKDQITIQSFVKNILNSHVTKELLMIPMDLTTKPLHTDNATDITKIVCQHCLTSTDAITFRWKHWIEGSESDDTSEYVRDAVQKGREIARKLQSSFSSLQFHYGAETTFEDITPKVLSSCIEPVEMQMGSHRETKWCIVIPASYKTRDEKFGDPLYGFHKQINVFYGTMVLVYREDDSIIIPIL